MCFEPLPLELENQFFAIAPEFSIPEVALYGVKLANEAFDIFPARCNRKKGRWRFDEQAGSFRQTAKRVLWVKDCGITRKITVNRGDDCLLVVCCGLVAVYSRKPQFLKHGRNVLMLELNRS